MSTGCKHGLSRLLFVCPLEPLTQFEDQGENSIESKEQNKIFPCGLIMKKIKKNSSYSLTKFDHPEKFINFNTHTKKVEII